MASLVVMFNKLDDFFFLRQYIWQEELLFTIELISSSFFLASTIFQLLFRFQASSMLKDISFLGCPQDDQVHNYSSPIDSHTAKEC